MSGLGNRFKENVYEEYESYIAEKSEEILKANRTGNILRDFREEINFEPFIDIMQGENVKVKAMVIKKLSKDFNPENIKLLKSALNDPLKEVRLYAASALVEMESELNEKIRKAQEVLRGMKTFKAYGNLGDFYWLYAQSGLMEKALAYHYLHEAISAYQKSLEMNPHQSQLEIEYVRCLIELGEFQTAQGFVEHSLTQWPQNTDLIFLSAAIYFQLGLFPQIPKRLNPINISELDDQQKELVHFWTQE